MRSRRWSHGEARAGAGGRHTVHVPQARRPPCSTAPQPACPNRPHQTARLPAPAPHRLLLHAPPPCSRLLPALLHFGEPGGPAAGRAEALKYLRFCLRRWGGWGCLRFQHLPCPWRAPARRPAVCVPVGLRPCACCFRPFSPFDGHASLSPTPNTRLPGQPGQRGPRRARPGGGAAHTGSRPGGCVPAFFRVFRVFRV